MLEKRYHHAWKKARRGWLLTLNLSAASILEPWVPNNRMCVWSGLTARQTRKGHDDTEANAIDARAANESSG